MLQAFLYMRDPQNAGEADSNHYALPLSISPVISTDTKEVIRIDHLPTGKDNTITGPQPWQDRPAATAAGLMMLPSLIRRWLAPAKAQISAQPEAQARASTWAA